MSGILGIGNALVDILIKIPENRILKELGLKLGSMNLIEKEKIDQILKITESFAKKISTGGSVANTITGLAKLGLPSGFIGKIGNDNLGRVFREQMNENDIEANLFMSDKDTGKAYVFVSKDSERTFAVYLGAAVELDDNDIRADLFTGYDFLYFEGYLVPNKELVEKILKFAKNANNKVAIDLSSFNVVQENREYLSEIIEKYVDIVFANEHEAYIFSGKKDPYEAISIISEKCQLAIVKLAAQGSLIKTTDNLYQISSVKAKAIDSTGAGDLYAAGIFYGLANNYSLETCGKIASHMGAKIVEVIGAKISEEIWHEIKMRINEIENNNV